MTTRKALLFLFSLLFFFAPMDAQHDSLFYNFKLGLKIGATYTLTNGTQNVATFDGITTVNHEIDFPEDGYGFNAGVIGLFKLGDLLYLQSELNMARVAANFEYNTITTHESAGIIEDRIGNYQLKELFFQVPVMAKVIVGKDWQFGFGAGVYWRGGGFSNGNWEYRKTEYGRWIGETWAPETPPIVKDLDDKISLYKDSNFGFLIDLGVMRPITKVHSMFINFRYQQAFSEENEIPIFKQQNIIADVGVIVRLRRPVYETDEDGEERRVKRRGGFDF